MSLDIVILDDSETIEKSVPLSVDEHWVLLQHANKLNLRLWIRMSDYYSDVDYVSGEINTLVEEANRLLKMCEDTLLAEKMNNIIQLLHFAMHEHRPVSVVAD